MKSLWRECSFCIVLLLVCAATTGCLGWGDLFAPKHSVAGDFSLFQGEPERDGNFYLLERGKDITGSLYQIGWNQQYIVFTDTDGSWPKPWSVIRVKDHFKFTVTETQRVTDPAFKGTEILSAHDAWNTKSR